MNINEFLPLVIDFLLIILLVICIIIGVKLIITLNKVDKITDDVNKKLKTLDTFFGLVDAVSEKVNDVTDRIAEFFSSIIDKLFFRRKEEETEDE